MTEIDCGIDSTDPGGEFLSHTHLNIHERKSNRKCPPFKSPIFTLSSIKSFTFPLPFSPGGIDIESNNS